MMDVSILATVFLIVTVFWLVQNAMWTLAKCIIFVGFHVYLTVYVWRFCNAKPQQCEDIQINFRLLLSDMLQYGGLAFEWLRANVASYTDNISWYDIYTRYNT